METVPEARDIEQIEKMLKDVGEKELEIGKIAEESIEERAEDTLEDAGQVIPPESEEKEESELLDLLKDIEIGLSEERELEEKLKKKQEMGEEAEMEEVTGAPSEKPALSEEPSPPEAEVPQEVSLREEEEEGIEEGFDLPEDFDMSMLGIDEGPPVDYLREAGAPKEEPPAPEREEAAAAEERKESPRVEPTVEPPPSEEAPLEPEGVAEAEEAAEKPQIEEFEMPELEELESIVEIPGPPEGEEVAEEPVLREEKPFEIELEEELPPIPEEEPAAGPAPEVEEVPGIEGIPEIEEIPGLEGIPGIDFEIEEELSGPEAGIEEKAHPPEEEAEEIPAEAGPPEEEPEIDLSDEDIILIKTKLKQLSPAVASEIRNLIVNVSLPPAQMTALLRLLIRDAPELDIIQFIERVSGRKIMPARKPIEVPAWRLKPGRFAVVAENLGPLIRVGGLFVTILAILGMIFMVFLYKPIRSSKFYREGVEYIRSANYQEAEKSFQKAVRIYEKVKEYDIFGWEYMLAGNYDAAEQKFKSGIQVDSGMKNLSLREHLAKLYNILQRYSEADALYDKLLLAKPGAYHYQKLKGTNLIDWGREDRVHLDEAYVLFTEAYEDNKRNSDPLFQLLRIDILKENNDSIQYLYSVLKERYPQDVDAEVYTELAGYYISKKYLDPVWDILSSVIQKYPEYPRAYFIFSTYHKMINNKVQEEGLLKLAIEAETGRELRFPWETRDRELLSNAYNNLGEIYARMEVPGKTAEAISYFKEAININDENTQAYFNLAQTYFYQEKNYELALRYYERARVMGFENYDLRFNLGLLYYYNKDFEKALRQWSRMDEVMSDNPNVSFAVGNAFLHLGKYNAALGEFLMLAEIYDGLVAALGDIKPWSAYHKRIVLGAAAVYNNLGVTFQKLYESTGISEYQKDSLVYLYKAGELADTIDTERGIIQYNINYIIHPKVIRSDMAINDNISEDYRFVTH